MEDDEIGGACSLYEESRGTLYKFVVEKPEGKRPLGRPRHTWKDNLQMCIFTLYSQFGLEMLQFRKKRSCLLLCIFLKNGVSAVAKTCDFVKFQKKEVQKFDCILSVL